MITVEVYAIRDSGDRGHGVATLTTTAGGVPTVGHVVRVPDHGISYWVVEQVVWERLGAHPLVELWARPL